MNSMVSDSGSVDVVAYLMVVPSLLLATMLAVYVPARRAAKNCANTSASLRVVPLNVLFRLTMSRKPV